MRITVRVFSPLSLIVSVWPPRSPLGPLAAVRVLTARVPNGKTRDTVNAKNASDHVVRCARRD